MKMTKAEFDLVERHVRDKLTVWTCRACGGNEYALESSVYELDLCSVLAAETNERPLSVVVMTCGKCGIVQMISAAAVGIRG